MCLNFTKDILDIITVKLKFLFAKKKDNYHFFIEINIFFNP